MNRTRRYNQLNRRFPSSNDGLGPKANAFFGTLGKFLRNQTLLLACAPQESLITLGTALGQIFPDNPCEFFPVCFRHGFSHRCMDVIRVKKNPAYGRH